MPLGGWIEPTPQAACFNPYSFSCAYDFAAYKKASGPYNNSAMNRAILGSKSASELSTEYHRHPWPPYKLPLPPPRAEKKKVQKAPMRFFVREFDGGELTKVTKGVMSTLQEEEDGGDDTDDEENKPIVVTHKSPSGDMKLVMKQQPPQNLCATDLNLFFNTLDRDKSTAVLQSADGPGPSSLFQHPPAPAGAMNGQQIPQTAPRLSLPIEHQASCSRVSDVSIDKDSEDTISLGAGEDMSWDLLEESQSSPTLAMVTDKEDVESRQLVEHATDGVWGSCTEDVPMNSEEAEPSKGPDISNMSMVFDATGDGSHGPDPTAEHPEQPASDVQQTQSTAFVLDPAHPAPAVPLVPPQSP